jgi:hypothetical protein
MKRKSKTMLAALVAALALGAVASASASAALPEFSAKTEFVGKLNASKWSWLGREWSYSQGALEGTMATPNTLSGLEVVFSGGSVRTCDNRGNNGERSELVWKGLSGKIGYLNKEKKQVGFLIGGSGNWASCIFPAYLWEIVFSGKLMGEITPINTKTKKFTVNFATAKGSQQFTNFEGEAAEPLKGLGEPIAVEVAFTLTTEKEIELKA